VDRAVTKKAKAVAIQSILAELYPTMEIPLNHRDPFTLLVAVLLSAQTTDKKVNEVTPALFARADSPEKLAALTVEEVHGFIRAVGLAPQKAKHLVAMAQILCQRHAGQVPASLEELEALPGVGHKTASVVMCQAFQQPAFPVDTHIHRLAWRWGLSNGKSVEQTERDLKALFPRSSWIDLHLQIIYFGRQHCPARGHKPELCPICSWAFSAARQKQEAAAKQK
jgi:endonuclease III